MDKLFKTTNENLLLRYCIISLFAIPVFISVLFLLGMGIQGLITGNWTFSLNPKAGLIINYIGNALFLLLYYKLLFSKNFNLSKKAKTGVIILAVCIILSVLNKIFNSVTTELINNGQAEGDHTALMLYSFYQSFREIFNIVGLWLFISGCKVEQPLKRFVKATPFITMLATFMKMLLMDTDFSKDMGILLVSYVLPIIYLVVVYYLTGINKKKNTYETEQ